MVKLLISEESRPIILDALDGAFVHATRQRHEFSLLGMLDVSEKYGDLASSYQKAIGEVLRNPPFL